MFGEIGQKMRSYWAQLSGVPGRIPYQSGGAMADSPSLQWDSVNTQLVVTDPTSATATVKVGRLPGFSGYAGIWLAAATPGASNYAFLGDGGGNVNVNAATTLNLGVNNNRQIGIKTITAVTVGYNADTFTTYASLTTLTAFAPGATYTPLDLVGYASQSAQLMRLRQLSSTAAAQSCGIIDATFNNSTNATWTGNLLLYAGDNTSSNAGKRLGVQIQSDGTQALLGFYGATPVAKTAVTGTRGGNAALASLLTALANLGLITDSSS